MKDIRLYVDYFEITIGETIAKIPIRMIYVGLDLAVRGDAAGGPVGVLIIIIIIIIN